MRGGDILEKFSEVDAIVFDKTGTLTIGKPVVTKVIASHREGDENTKLSVLMLSVLMYFNLCIVFNASIT